MHWTVFYLDGMCWTLRGSMVCIGSVYHVVWSVLCRLCACVHDNISAACIHIHTCSPTELYMNRLEIDSAVVKDSIKIDGNHIVVVYKQLEGLIERRIIQGPTMLVPDAHEWWINKCMLSIVKRVHTTQKWRKHVMPFLESSPSECDSSYYPRVYTTNKSPVAECHRPLTSCWSHEYMQSAIGNPRVVVLFYCLDPGLPIFNFESSCCQSTKGKEEPRKKYFTWAP